MKQHHIMLDHFNHSKKHKSVKMEVVATGIIPPMDYMNLGKIIVPDGWTIQFKQGSRTYVCQIHNVNERITYQLWNTKRKSKVCTNYRHAMYQVGLLNKTKIRCKHSEECITSYMDPYIQKWIRQQTDKTQDENMMEFDTLMISIVNSLDL